MKCSCGGETQIGFIPDFGTMVTFTAVWYPGEPTTQKSAMERFRTGAGVATERGEGLMLEAHRCNDCGAVQLFANNPPPPGASAA